MHRNHSHSNLYANIATRTAQGSALNRERSQHALGEEVGLLSAPIADLTSTLHNQAAMLVIRRSSDGSEASAWLTKWFVRLQTMIPSTHLQWPPSLEWARHLQLIAVTKLGLHHCVTSSNKRCFTWVAYSKDSILRGWGISENFKFIAALQPLAKDGMLCIYSWEISSNFFHWHPC